MTTYEARLTSAPSDNFSQTIVSGNVQLQLNFKWDNTLQEPYDEIIRALKARADADPLIDNNSLIERDYDWIDWRLSLPADLETYLEEGGKYPQSIKNVNNVIKADILRGQIEEAKELEAVRSGYEVGLRWCCSITDDSGDVVVCSVEPGGWVNEQSLKWRLKFESDLDKIGHDDLLKMLIVTEVYDEYENIV